MASQMAEGSAASARGSLEGTVLGALRGVGQVDFQASVWTSLVILAALWVESWQMGIFAIIGAVVATLTARLLAVPRDTLNQGLMTYCGVLGALAMVVYLGHHPSAYVMAVAAAVMCTLVTATPPARPVRAPSRYRPRGRPRYEAVADRPATDRVQRLVSTSFTTADRLSFMGRRVMARRSM
ncbi:urea transporter [Streptomyces sp. NPDC019826]|uniref:urea transporter n=1 Tax=unclassified Streptomyces TaxID=2593676 RepID=UPI0033DCD12F